MFVGNDGDNMVEGNGGFDIFAGGAGIDTFSYENERNRPGALPVGVVVNLQLTVDMFGNIIGRGSDSFVRSTTSRTSRTSLAPSSQTPSSAAALPTSSKDARTTMTIRHGGG